jgi:xylan 1,4-beta-xylosidase
VCLTIKGANRAAPATIRRIDLEHANARRRWEQMGEPEYLSSTMLDELAQSSLLRNEVQAVAFEDGSLRIEVRMPPQSVAAIEIAL